MTYALFFSEVRTIIGIYWTKEFLGFSFAHAFLCNVGAYVCSNLCVHWKY